MKPKKSIDNARSYLDSKRLDAFEIFCLEKGHFLADAKDGKVESLEEATEAGLAVRVVNDHRLGFSYTTSLEKERIKDCIDWAIAGSREVDPDDGWGFAAPKPTQDFGWMYNDKNLGGIPVLKKAGLALALESAALRTDPRVKKVRRSLYEESKVRVLLANSEGVDIAFEKTMVGCEIVAVAESGGDSQWAWDFDFSHTFDGLNAEGVGFSAAGRALSLLGARSIPTMQAVACLHPFVAAQFLKVLSKGFYGDNIYKKKSPLVGKLGETLYSEVLNVADDGLMEGGYGSSPFDGEGSPCVKTFLIKSGVVRNWLADIYWGKKLKLPSTGSSARDSVKGMPAIGVSNVYIEPAEVSPEGLFRRMGRGFYITDVFGVHTINPITGDFSVGAEGQWLEGGAVKYPVKGVVIAGNLHDIFRNVVGVGDDLRFMGNVGAPTLLISEIQVSGQ